MEARSSAGGRPRETDDGRHPSRRWHSRDAALRSASPPRLLPRRYGTAAALAHERGAKPRSRRSIAWPLSDGSLPAGWSTSNALARAVIA